ncbi:hypothetical protein KEM48_008194 [Puccinia striiformis f. sp. tritici PST-130]|nr:hypothetical protein KEM48_008194 [Puccinia striiformis f. sp. tritici PST-130]
MYFLNYTPCVLLSWLHLTHPLWAHPSRPLTDKAVLEGDLIKDYIPQAHTDNIISLNADASPHENRPTNFVANIHQHVSTILADQVLHSANPEHVLNKDETSTRRIATKSDIEDHPFFSMMSSIFESRAVYLKMLTPAERTRADRLFAESKLPKNFNENLKQIDQIWTQILPDIAQIDTRWSTVWDKLADMDAKFRKAFLDGYSQDFKPITENEHNSESILMSNQIQTIYQKLIESGLVQMNPKIAKF